MPYTLAFIAGGGGFAWRWRRSLLPPFWHFAHTRMTTPPFDINATAPLGTVPQPDPAAGLLAAMAKIPALSPLPAPPQAPPGKHWVPTKQAENATFPLVFIDHLEALNGRWTPEIRYHLRAVIDYLETPAMQAALAEIAEQARSTTLPAGYGWGGAGPYSQIRNTVKILTRRRRYHMAQLHDTAAACRDIQTIQDLCAMMERDGALIQHLVAMACRALIYSEITIWCREFPLTREQERDLQAALQSHCFDLAAGWRNMNDNESRFALCMLDACYTKDADGDGWFVPFAPQTDDLADKALSALNLLSPLVNDRLTVTRKIEFVVGKANRAADLPFQEAVKILGTDSDGRQQFGQLLMGNPVDVPAGMVLNLSRSRLYTSFICCAVEEAAAITSLALSAYRTEHGQYPAYLSSLVPEYLSSLPMDAITGQSLLYRLDERDGYSLYSPGEDGVDSGGALRDAQGKLYEGRQGPDWTYVGLGREEFEYGVEWTLVPNDTEQPNAASQPQ